jgi:hypothetical protein
VCVFMCVCSCTYVRGCIIICEYVLVSVSVSVAARPSHSLSAELLLLCCVCCVCCVCVVCVLCVCVCV